MKKLLSGLLAVTMLAGSCNFKLNNCEASGSVFIRQPVQSQKNSGANKINFDVKEGCQVTYNKDNNEIKVESKESGLIWSILKKIVLIGSSALVATILVRNSDKAKAVYQVIKGGLNSTAKTAEEAFACGKGMLVGEKCPNSAVCNFTGNAKETAFNAINSFQDQVKEIIGSKETKE